MRKLLLLLILMPSLASAQNIPSIGEKTKNMKAHPGFFNFYMDESMGKLYMEIDKLDAEILYQVSLPAGLGSNDIGLDRGLQGNTAIIKFTRTGNRIMMVQPNYDYRALTNDAAEKRAVEQSFAQSTLWGFTVEAESKNSVLIDMSTFLLRDAMHVSSTLAGADQGAYSVDASRSAIYPAGTKNFPDNTEMESSLTYTTGAGKAGSLVSTVAPNADAITLRIHHSFVQLPDANYKTRDFDARAGYFPTSYFNYSSPVSEPIQKYLISRHRLEKKDPSAEMSEAKKPIIYYLDNGTPEPIRSALLEGAGWWNQAFEAAGFTNAFQVKILPADADPMDIRYNMINWVHRSTRGWSYGASIVDPRTGEIIKGNVSLGSLRVRQDYLIAQGLLAPFANGAPVNDLMLKMALQRLKQLAAHEVGHTLGLMHNYIASTQNNSSVMDYPSPIVKLDAGGNISLNEAYGNAIGEWDKISIAYGYREFPDSSTAASELDKILTAAAARGLSFISDRDARDPAGLNPNAHLWDVGKDPIQSLKDVMVVRKKALEQFGLNNIKKNVPMAMLEDVLVPVYFFNRYQLEAVCKIVGGMDYSYALKGDGQSITRAIPKAQQLKALQSVLDCISPKALALPENITSLIPPRPAGYEYNRELFNRRTGLSFDPLSAAESAANLPLSFLFNPSRLNRMVQMQAAGTGLGIDEMLAEIFKRTWKTQGINGPEELILKQEQQMVLTYLMSVYVSKEASFATKAAMMQGIEELRLLANGKVNGAEKGYYLMTIDRIKDKEKAKPFIAEPLPPGAPIGYEDEF